MLRLYWGSADCQAVLGLCRGLAGYGAVLGPCGMRDHAEAVLGLCWGCAGCEAGLGLCEARC